MPVVPTAPGGGGAVTRQQYERIRLDGIAKRQAGRPITENPHANKPREQRQADAWEDGWRYADARRRA